MKWLIDPTSIPLLKAVDFWFGAFGFAITIATFYFGWRKLLAVQASADAASLAIDSLRIRVRHYEAGGDVAEALYALQSAIRHIDALSWVSVVNAIADVRRCANRLDQPIELISPDVAKRLRRASLKYGKVITTIDAFNLSGGVAPDAGAIQQLIREGQDTFDKIKQLLEENVK